MSLVSTFYKVANLENYQDMRECLLEQCNAKGIKGTIILSPEGINATIAGAEDSVDSILEFIKQDVRLADVEDQRTYADFQPFQKTKVVLKNEIVTLAEGEVNMQNRGDYIDPEDWDEFISRDDVILIDTRNHYEVTIGSFKGAIDPETENFRDFPDWFRNWCKKNNISSDQKIAMCCTGGIRCEKSTAYLKGEGYNNVYHLKGGIINYLKTKHNSKDKKWYGDCFIFDDRVSLDDKLKPSMSVRCSNCDVLVSTDDLKNTTRGRVICLKCQPS